MSRRRSEGERFTLQLDSAMSKALRYIMDRKGIQKKTMAIRYALIATESLLVFEDVAGTSIEDLSMLKLEELKKKLRALEIGLKELEKT